MSLISLLIALTVERYLPSSRWQFSTFYRQYIKFSKIKSKPFTELNEKVASIVFVIAPSLLCYLFIRLADSDLVTFIVSTLALIVCLGCAETRAVYRKFLQSAFRGQPNQCDDCHQQLAQDKNLPGLGLGQILIWLNYRYFIAVMFFFVLFGAPGAILYRQLVALDEHKDESPSDVKEQISEAGAENIDIIEQEQQALNENVTASQNQAYYFVENSLVVDQSRKVLSAIDWVLIRIVAFGYMLVGHFSRALPVWLDYVFNAKKPAYQLLIDVAEKSEDVVVDEDDCTAAPCTLVRLAKRTLLLCLVVLSLLIVTGVIS